MAEEKPVSKKPSAAKASEGAPHEVGAKENKKKAGKAPTDASSSAPQGGAYGGDAGAACYEGREGTCWRPRGLPGPRPPPAKPVEMVGGVAKQPTAEDLLKEEL